MLLCLLIKLIYYFVSYLHNPQIQFAVQHGKSVYKEIMEDDQIKTTNQVSIYQLK